MRDSDTMSLKQTVSETVWSRRMEPAQLMKSTNFGNPIAFSSLLKQLQTSRNRDMFIIV